MLDHVEQQHRGHPPSQIRIQIREVRSGKKERTHIFVDAGTAEIAAIGIEPGGPQHADVMATSRTNFQDRVPCLQAARTQSRTMSAAGHDASSAVHIRADRLHHIPRR